MVISQIIAKLGLNGLCQRASAQGDLQCIVSNEDVTRSKAVGSLSYPLPAHPRLLSNLALAPSTSAPLTNCVTSNNVAIQGSVYKGPPARCCRLPILLS